MNHTDALEKAAITFIKCGISIIPVKRDKKPIFSWAKYQQRIATQEEIASWFRNYKNRIDGIAAVTGKISNVFVVDTEYGANISSMDWGKGPVAISGGGGKHFWYRHPGFTVKNSAGLIMEKVDVRGDGGYIVVPPSLHLSGNQYKWENPFIEDFLDFLPDMLHAPPAWLLNILENNNNNYLFNQNNL